MCTQVLQIGISKEKFKLWLMVERERERETHRRRGEGEGKGLLNCCFPVPAEKWGGGECGALGNTGKPVFWTTVSG